MTTAREYVDFLSTDYLSDYIAGGGAAVKFIVAPNDESADALFVAPAPVPGPGVTRQRKRSGAYRD